MVIGGVESDNQWYNWGELPERRWLGSEKGFLLIPHWMLRFLGWNRPNQLEEPVGNTKLGKF